MSSASAIANVDSAAFDTDIVGRTVDTDRVGTARGNRWIGRRGVDLAHPHLGVTLQVGDAFVTTGGDDEDVFVTDGQLFIRQPLGRCGDPLLRIRVVEFERRPIGRLHLQLIGGELHHLGIGRHGRLAKVAEDHATVVVGDPLPGPHHDIVEGLLEIELRNRGDGGAKTAALDDLPHGLDHLRITIHDAIVTQHLRIRRQRASGHRTPWDHGLDGHRLRWQEVVGHALLENGLRLANLVDIDVKVVLRIAQGVPHGEYVGLTGTPRNRSQGQIDGVDAGVESGLVGTDGDAGGLMGVELDVRALRQHSAGLNDGFENGGRYRRARRVLETDRVEGDVRIENLSECALVEVGVVGTYTSGRQLHHGHTDLVVETGVGDALAGVDQILNVVEGVKISDRRHAVFGEQICVQLDDIARLRIEANHVHATRKRLQIGIWSRRFAELIHHVEGIFLTVEIQGLIPGAPPCFEIRNSRVPGSSQSGEEVGREHTRPVDGLESVTERRAHEGDLFLHWVCFLVGIRLR